MVSQHVVVGVVGVVIGVCGAVDADVVVAALVLVVVGDDGIVNCR